LEGEQERGRKTEGKEGTRRGSSKAGAKTDFAMTFSVAEEANAFSAGNNRVCSNRRGRKDECSGSKRVRTRNKGSKKRPLCDGGR